ncbi:hypothetical protein [Pontibacter russatus]|uniref:hypothetical protein n=1 Tax=Pontibacter russatus TaxID=2694929 RepID=UPI00137AEA18|nr:hypothetical protein [Pontibacter russatus]
MVTVTNVETLLWNKIISLLKSDNWGEAYRYDGFDARVDFDFIILEKEGEEVLFGWDNWIEGEIQCSERSIKTIETLIGKTLKKGKPVSLKPDAVKLYRRMTIR